LQLEAALSPVEKLQRNLNAKDAEIMNLKYGVHKLKQPRGRFILKLDPPTVLAVHQFQTVYWFAKSVVGIRTVGFRGRELVVSSVCPRSENW
jgi:hypothetical protein